MSDTFTPSNSIWPNGIQVDSDGYALFYQMGENTIDVPSTVSAWPEGSKLISPFVYDENDNLVGFCDTKAMTANSVTTIVMPYEHIEVDFSSMEKNSVTIHAPNATTKTVTYDDGTTEIIPDVVYKYKGCITLEDIKSVDVSYMTNDVVNGSWTEILSDAEDLNDMFFDHYDSSLESSIGYSGLVSFTGDLSSLSNGSYMFFNCENLTTFDSDLSSLTNGEAMFYGDYKLTNFGTTNLKSLTNGDWMFTYVPFESFTYELPNVQTGYAMFCYCDKLKSFDINLSKMTDGTYAFFECFELESFTADLSSMTVGYQMFHDCHALTSVRTNLSKLEDADYMFYNNYNLISFNAPLDSLTYGYGTFHGCSKLTSFNSNLSSLTNGYQMFRDCSLDSVSLSKIANTIKDVTELTNGSKTYDPIYKTIHIGLSNTTPTNEENNMLSKIHSKGWDVFVNGFGDSYLYSPTTMTASLGDEDEPVTMALPYYAKPIPSDEKHAEFVDSEGNFFDVIGGTTVFVKDIDTYGMFTSREDAIAQMRLTPHVKTSKKLKIERH